MSVTVLEVGDRVSCSTPAEAFRAHATQIHGYLFRRAGQEAADDLLGEVFAVVVRRWSGLSVDGGPALLGESPCLADTKSMII